MVDNKLANANEMIEMAFLSDGVVLDDEYVHHLLRFYEASQALKRDIVESYKLDESKEMDAQKRDLLFDSILESYHISIFGLNQSAMRDALGLKRENHLEYFLTKKAISMLVIAMDWFGGIHTIIWKLYGIIPDDQDFLSIIPDISQEMRKKFFKDCNGDDFQEFLRREYIIDNHIRRISVQCSKNDDKIKRIESRNKLTIKDIQ